MEIWKFLNHNLFNSKGCNFENHRFWTAISFIKIVGVFFVCLLFFFFWGGVFFWGGDVLEFFFRF